MTRQGTWLVLIAVTWYLAAMFRTAPLTVLLLSEIGLLVVMALVSLYFRHTLDASFSSETAFGEKERDCPCRIRLQASGRLPAGRPRLTLALSYPAQRGKSVQRFYGGAEARRETEVTFYVYPPYCGPLHIELRQILTWDYLFLFPSRRRKREHMTLMVLPPPRALNLSLRSFADVSGPRAQSDVSAPTDGASPETRDLREYRPGDSARSIHWKLSARTGDLWARDYEDEREERFTLSLDLSAEAPPRRGFRREVPADAPERRDAFYEVLSAIVLGLLRYRSAVRIDWRDGAQSRRWDVTDEKSRQAFFLRLYQSDPPTPGESDAPAPNDALSDFSLDSNLCWQRGVTPLWRFDASDVAREIAEKTFVI